MSTRYVRLAESLPWVTRLKKAEKCDAYVRPPLSLYFRGESRRKTKHQTLEGYRCKNHARWHYRARKNSKWYAGESGIYCWSHLVSRLQSMEEVDRQQKYWNRYPEKKEKILAGQG